MTELRLVTEEPAGAPASDPEEGPFSGGTPLPSRLPPAVTASPPTSWSSTSGGG